MIPKELFDIETLTDEELGQFEFLVNSPSYQRVFKGYVYNIVRGVERLMKDPSQARKDAFPNDFLAGQATALEGLVKFLDQVLEQTNTARMVNSQLHTSEEEYTRLRDLGLVRHSGQVATAADVQAEIDRAMSEDY